MENKNLPHLYKYAERLYGFLCSCYFTYRNTKYYLTHGCFYKSDKDIRKLHGKSKNTVLRAKRCLRDIGLINFRIHAGRGKATDYWILSEEIVKAKDQKEPPFERFRGTK